MKRLAILAFIFLVTPPPILLGDLLWAIDISIYNSTDIEMDAVNGTGLIVSARYNYSNPWSEIIFSAVGFSPQSPQINSQNDFWSLSYPISQEDCQSIFGDETGGCSDHVTTTENCVHERRPIVDVVASPRSPAPGVSRYYVLVCATEDGTEWNRGYWNHIRVYSFDVSGTSASRRLIYYDVFSVDRFETCGNCEYLCDCAYASLTEGGIAVQSDGPSSETIFFVWQMTMDTNAPYATVYGYSTPWFGGSVSSNALTVSETNLHWPTTFACHSGSPWEIINTPYFTANITNFDAYNVVEKFDCDMVYDPGGESDLESLMIVAFKMDNPHLNRQEIWTAAIDLSGIPFAMLDLKKQQMNLTPGLLLGSPRIALNPFWEEDSIVAYGVWETWTNYPWYGWKKYIAEYEIGRWSKDTLYNVPTEGSGAGRVDISFPSEAGARPFTAVFDPVFGGGNSRVWVYDPGPGGSNYWVSDSWRTGPGMDCNECLGSACTLTGDLKDRHFGSVVTDRSYNLDNRYVLWYAKPKDAPAGQGLHHHIVNLP